MTQGDGETGQDDDAEAGRAAVGRLLVGRVAAAGLARGRGVSVTDHGARLKSLCDRLAYMTPENLQTLAEVILDNAEGTPPAWPSEALVMQWARALQVPPPRERRIVTSWLASVEGPVAEAGGYLVELYRFLLRHGRPPLAMDVRQLREQAADNNRTATLIRDRIARDVVQSDDRAWLAAYVRDEGEAQALIEQGRVRRAAKGEGVAA